MGGGGVGVRVATGTGVALGAGVTVVVRMRPALVVIAVADVDRGRTVGTAEAVDHGVAVSSTCVGTDRNCARNAACAAPSASAHRVCRGTARRQPAACQRQRATIASQYARPLAPTAASGLFPWTCRLRCCVYCPASPSSGAMRCMATITLALGGAKDADRNIAIRIASRIRSQTGTWTEPRRALARPQERRRRHARCGSGPHQGPAPSLPCRSPFAPLAMPPHQPRAERGPRGGEGGGLQFEAARGQGRVASTSRTCRAQVLRAIDWIDGRLSESHLPAFGRGPAPRTRGRGGAGPPRGGGEIVARPEGHVLPLTFKTALW